MCVDVLKIVGLAIKPYRAGRSSCDCYSLSSHRRHVLCGWSCSRRLRCMLENLALAESPMTIDIGNIK
jgi:hypothetical protein